MPKRSLAAILLAAFVLMLGVVAAGCGDDDDESSSAGRAQSRAHAGEAGDQGRPRHRHRRPQRPLVQPARQRGPRAGQVRARRRGPRARRPKSDADYVPNLSTLAQQKYDLVIGVGFLMSDAVNTVATKFPDTNFAIIDFPQAGLKDKPANVRGLLFKENEAGYLAGYLAALYVKDKGGDQVISSVGGQKIPPVDGYIAGYQAGGQGGQRRRSRRSTATRRTSSTRRSARRSRSTRSRRARRSSSRSPASAASARSTRPRRRACSASASTPTRATWATTS